MAKPFTGFAIVTGWSLRTSTSFSILGITSEKGRRIYGRTVPGDRATHTTTRDLVYRFPPDTTEAFALQSAKRAEVEHARHAEAIARAEETLWRLRQTQKTLTLQAAKGLDADGK
jgi:hypothetical protein